MWCGHIPWGEGGDFSLALSVSSECPCPRAKRKKEKRRFNPNISMREWLLLFHFIDEENENGAMKSFAGSHASGSHLWALLMELQVWVGR